jgi:two-component system response regulator
MPLTKRFLLVDDDLNDIELILSALEEHQLSSLAVVLRDGAEALDYLFRRGRFENVDDGTPGLILLDLKMPKVDGLEVLRQIKSDATLKRIPVVMMTSSREQNDLIRSYNFGVNSYVVKPISLQKFVETVKRVGIYWLLQNEEAPTA